MNIVTLDEIKANSRILQLNEQEEQNLLQVGETAEEMVLNMVDRSLGELYSKYGSIPSPIKRAVLALADHLWTHPGIVTSGRLSGVPYTIDAMVKHYAKL